MTLRLSTGSSVKQMNRFQIKGWSSCHQPVVRDASEMDNSAD